MRALLDTDIFIDILRMYKPAMRILREIANGKLTAYFSVVTEVELFSGKECKRTDKRRAVEELLSLCSKLELTNEIARLAGKLRRNYNSKLGDSMIAATAIANKLPIMTRNVKHFKGLPVKLIKPYD